MPNFTFKYKVQHAGETLKTYRVQIPAKDATEARKKLNAFIRSRVTISIERESASTNPLEDMFNNELKDFLNSL